MVMEENLGRAVHCTVVQRTGVDDCTVVQRTAVENCTVVQRTAVEECTVLQITAVKALYNWTKVNVWITFCLGPS